jgi:hypothetical protein
MQKGDLLQRSYDRNEGMFASSWLLFHHLFHQNIVDDDFSKIGSFFFQAMRDPAFLFAQYK